MTDVEPLRAGDPTEIGPYRLEGVLGAGGFGTVYLGRSPGGRRVAVKTVHRHLLGRDPSFRVRFRREIAAIGEIGGFWTPAIKDSDPDGDPPWYAAEYVAAPDLRTVIRTKGADERAGRDRSRRRPGRGADRDPRSGCRPTTRWASNAEAAFGSRCVG